jgi:hypothetical protein
MENYKDSASTTTYERRSGAHRGHHQLSATSAFANGQQKPQSQPFHSVADYLLKLLVGGYGPIHDVLTRGCNNENVKVYV